MRRLNVYYMHSDKIDYNNLFYKKILSSSVYLSQNMILPMSKEYQDKYRKDLIDKADVIIAEVSNPSLGLVLELRWLQKQDKPKLYLSLNNIIPSKVKRLVPSITETSDSTYLKTIEDFILEHAKEVKDIGDNSVTLGEI